MSRKSAGGEKVVTASKAEASSEAVRRELERVLQSPPFAQSESLKRFLRYVVECKLDGREGELKEMVLGTEVFDRGDEYDPRTDPIVRVQATRLRGKLREYYHDVAEAPDVVIELPKGTYVPEFRAGGQDPGTREPAPEPSDARPERSSRTLPYVAAAVAVLLVGTVLYRSVTAPDSSPEDIRSLLVLPFTDMSPDGDQGFYGDGIADEITTTLARVDGLDVTPRTTAFAFRDDDLERVFRAVPVDAVLQGSVRKSDESLRVGVQLLKAPDGRQVWSDTYEYPSEDVFRVQDVVARSVASAISMEIEAGPLPLDPDPRAYETYLRGRFELSRATPAAIARSIDLFEDAIRQDPDYAPAYAGLVQAYAMNVLGGFMAPDATRLEAREASRQALALDGSHPEALAAAIAYHLVYEWDINGAEIILERAQNELDASDELHVMKGLLRLAEARLDEAAAEIDLAAEIERGEPFVHQLGALIAFHRGALDDAADRAVRLLTWAPDYPYAWLLLARVETHRGALDEAAEALETYVRLKGDTPRGLAFSATLEAMWGNEPRAREILAKLEERRDQGEYVAPAFIARVWTALGEDDRALEALEAAKEDGSLPIIGLASDPGFEPLHDVPRFRALLEGLRLP